MDDLSTLRATSLWPQFPFLRVERRLDLRFDQPLCFVYAPEPDRVVPTVYFSNQFPPDLQEFDFEEAPAIEYLDLGALVGDGWRVIDE